MKQIFQSEHISFVEVSALLVKDYLVMVNDFERVARPMGSERSEPVSEEKELRWVQKKLEEKAAVYSMLEKKSGAFIGNIELMDIADSAGELGFALTADKQNLGYGTEAVSALVDYAVNTLGLKRVFLRTDPKNLRAIRVYEKCGFREYDRTDRHVFMEIKP